MLNPIDLQMDRSTDCMVERLSSGYPGSVSSLIALIPLGEI
jgi:hypothetical protein